MPLASQSGGELNLISKDLCWIEIPDPTNAIVPYKIYPRILPIISDQKSAEYVDTAIPGRSSPMKTYAHSSNRAITMQLMFLTVTPDDLKRNLQDLYAIMSAEYPRDGDPYKPPVICQVSCGEMISKKPLCCILRSYTANYPDNVAWDEKTLVPYFFTVNTSWEVVYSTSGGVDGDSNSLPNQERIFKIGQ